MIILLRPRAQPVQHIWSQDCPSVLRSAVVPPPHHLSSQIGIGRSRSHFPNRQIRIRETARSIVPQSTNIDVSRKSFRMPSARHGQSRLTYVGSAGLVARVTTSVGVETGAGFEQAVGMMDEYGGVDDDGMMRAIWLCCRWDGMMSPCCLVGGVTTVCSVRGRESCWVTYSGCQTRRG